MRHEINLLVDALPAASAGVSLRTAALAPLLCLGLFAGASAVLAVRGHKLEPRIAALESEALARKAHSSAQDVDLVHVEQQLAVHTAALNALKNSGAAEHAGFGDSLRALAQATVDGVWLTGITLEQGRILLHGRATVPPRISAFLDSLQAQPVFGGRSFKSLDIKQVKERNPATGPARPAAGSGLEFQLLSQPDPGNNAAPGAATSTAPGPATGGGPAASRSAP